MNDDELILTTSLSYVIVNLTLHIIFFVTIIFDDKYTNNSDNVLSISSCSSLTSETRLKRTIRSFSLVLYICLLITNWLRLGLTYLFSNLIQSCLIQSYFLHVLTHFHLHLTICLRLYWHYCFIFENSCQRITYRRISFLLLFIFICLCLLTFPSLSHQWTSIIFDKILQICIVNYTFNYSYTFFILTLSCLIPFILLCFSHKQQMKSIENRILTYKISNVSSRFRYSSLFILIWSFLNILLLIFLHIPIQYLQIRILIYYIQMISFLLEPIFYIFIFRSLSIIILLRPINEIYFL